MLRHGWLMGVILACAVTLLMAQERRGPGRGGFGFGGPAGGGPVPAAMLLAMPEVRKELGISESQMKSVDEWQNESMDQMRASFGAINFQELQTLSEEERDKRFAEARTKAGEAAKQGDEKLKKILDPRQFERLTQLRLQRDGTSVLTRPEIAKSLKLSGEEPVGNKFIEAC